MEIVNLGVNLFTDKPNFSDIRTIIIRGTLLYDVQLRSLVMKPEMAEIEYNENAVLVAEVFRDCDVWCWYVQIEDPALCPHLQKTKVEVQFVKLAFEILNL